MRRFECLEVLAPMIDDELVISNVARTSFEWHMLCPGRATSTRWRWAWSRRSRTDSRCPCPTARVIALDGDGGMLLNLGALATIGNTAPPNLISIVFDNAAYASTGGLPTATAGQTNLAAIGQGAGIDGSVAVSELVDFTAAITKAFTEPGPWLIVAQVVNEKPPVEPKLMDGRENKYRFVRYIEQTEGTTILKPSIVGRADSP